MKQLTKTERAAIFYQKESARAYTQAQQELERLAHLEKHSQFQGPVAEARESVRLLREEAKASAQAAHTILGIETNSLEFGDDCPECPGTLREGPDGEPRCDGCGNTFFWRK